MQGHRGVTKVVCLLAYCNPHDFTGVPITRFGDARLYGLGALGRIPLVLRILKIAQLFGGDPPLPSEEEQLGSLQKVADFVGVKTGRATCCWPKVGALKLDH